jgi:hypothetical protein
MLVSTIFTYGLGLLSISVNAMGLPPPVAHSSNTMHTTTQPRLSSSICKEMACLLAHQLWIKHELELIGASVTSCFKHADNNYNHKIDDLLSLRFFALLAIVLIRA